MDEKLEHLYDELALEYQRHFPLSGKQHVRSRAVMVDGGQHTIRLLSPHPVYIKAATGAYVYDLDGHSILDFWQGHFANILGHNPPEVTRVLSDMLAEGYGLQTGMVDDLAFNLAALLCQQTGAERVRFTTSGSLATMYAIMLARAYTGRSLVLKIGGGWHGSQPWGLVGVNYDERGFQHVESGGLPGYVEKEVVVTQYNNGELLSDVFAQVGDRLACFILEPVVGAGGAILARPDYLNLARELTQKHGALLIFDEVISGFRFRAGDVGRLYGIQPDLATFGKIIGGGMPVAAVAGRAEVMSLAGREGGRVVRFEGGTYSAHPSAMMAGLAMLRHLVDHENHIYGRLAELGQQVRERIEHIFANRGILAKCTGYPNDVVKGSSFTMVHFPLKPDVAIDSPDVVENPACCSLEIRERLFRMAMLLQDVYTMHGFGALSMAHTEDDLEKFYDACDHFSQMLRMAKGSVV